jgi:hypothetical protein
MVHRVIRGFVFATLGALLSASVAFAGNPAGTGQPGAECGDEDATVMPSGFTTGGFATAEEQYAGSGDASVTNAGSDSAVSQYDVACYQLTQHAH